MTSNRNFATRCSVACIVALAATRLSAAPATFHATSGDLAASVTFDTIGNTLVVKLSNNSIFDVLKQEQILTAVFFDISGPQLTLSPQMGSGLLAPGASILFDTKDSDGHPLGNVIGGE